MTRNMPRPYHAAPPTALNPAETAAAAAAVAEAAAWERAHYEASPQHLAATMRATDFFSSRENAEYEAAPQHIAATMQATDFISPRRREEPETVATPQQLPEQREFDTAKYCKPFCSFMTENPTVFHAVDSWAAQLESQGYSKLSERDLWADKVKRGGKYYFDRNGSSLIAFSIGENYKPGNGAAVIAAHVDALAARVKPVSTKPTKQGYVQLGVAHYGGALSQTWFDRDLSIGGRVFVKDRKTGKIHKRLAKLDWPIARIPTIAPHFGLRAEGQANRETRMVPIIGLDNSDLVEQADTLSAPPMRGAGGVFATSQPERLIKAIGKDLGLEDYTDIVNWDLEMYDSQPAQNGGLDKELIFAARVDDKLCSYAAIEGLLASSPKDSGLIKMAALFDDEEIGSLQRQGARGNMLPSAMERIVEALSPSNAPHSSTLHQTYANSFLISADVCQAYNPNYDDVYLKDHTPRLNVGVAVSFDSQDHMTTNGSSFSLLNEIAQRSDSVLQLFQIRNDGREGGTVGPMLSAATGMRAIDAGCPQLSMHSIRATTGSLDPGLGVQLFKGFYDHFEEVDQLFR